MPSHHRSRSRSPRDVLPPGVSEISKDDYFLKNTEFRVWLKDVKRKYFDELTGEEARSYFRKFVKAWNRGKLPAALYAGVDPASQSASSHTAYKWSFAARADADALRATRNQVSAATYGPNASTTASPPGPAAGAKIQGPTLPTSADLLLAREAAADELAAERTHKRKRARAEDRLREEDAVGPREPGREGQLERKRVKREADKSFRERGDDGFPDVDESALMGGDSFKDHVARRDAARKRREDAKASAKEEKFGASRERVAAMKEKEKTTMDMLQQLAKARFG